MARRFLYLMAGVLLALAAMELVFRLLPTPTATRIGRYIDPRITTYPPGLEFRTATGWSLENARTQRANEYGFIPDTSFAPAPDAVALIGDSLVEQSMLPPGRRLAAALSGEQGGRVVHSMGVPGSSLFDYLERVRFAHDWLGAREIWIVVERADVRQSLCAGGVYTDACLDERGEIRIARGPERGWLRDLLGRSALLQYVVGVLRLSPERIPLLFRAKPPPVVGAGGAPPTGGEDARPASPVTVAETGVIERFVAELAARTDTRVGLVIDPAILSLGRDAEYFNPALATMAAAAAEAGLTVVHPRRALQATARASGLDMRVGPYDAHWNPLANCVVAHAMAQTASSSGAGGTAGADAATEFTGAGCRELADRVG